MERAPRRLTLAHAVAMLAAAVVVHGLLCSPLLESAEAKPEATKLSASVVSAQSFRLVNKEGKEMGQLGFSKKSNLPMLRMAAADGHRRFEVEVLNSGVDVRVVGFGKESPAIVVGNMDVATVLAPTYLKFADEKKKQYGTYFANALTYGQKPGQYHTYFNSIAFKHLAAAVKTSLGTELPNSGKK